MGFSIKLAPGVRIRASSRGIRTSVGPRAARVHFGAGRTGFSTGAGPVGFYTSLGGGRGRSGSGGRGTSAAAYQRQLAAQQRQAAQAQRAEEAQHLAQAFLRILDLHRVNFSAATRPVAPEPAPPDRASIYQHYEQHALAGVGFFERTKRAQAKQRAAQWTDAEVRRQWTTLLEQKAGWQQFLDQRWQQLCSNDPDVVLETLEEAFEDNEAASAAVGVTGDEVSLVVLVPTVEQVVPKRMPTTTQAGNLSLRKLPQRDRAAYYKQFVCGQVLVTLREAFAVAPAIGSARVAVLRHDGPDSYGRPGVSCLLATEIHRASLNGVRWAEADAAAIVNDTSTELLLNPRARTGELLPLNLAGESAITELINAVDLAELTDR
ncbi:MULTISPECIES: DUF4236 domain-containing protein [Micromonospora]|uniref:DUF4236 domain-containing protein n=1 Tax=Micromonospora sicca TaxID=2202420 RepID=A0A317DAN3_9ACTN|nr:MULTISPECIES: DUF4236 domain-containing protein [unclassified Micromonospora]MBM0228805.1 DUF4236 domain-containing protein [Micromonospora sp. ATA51]PWR11948.1 hypothetical protein DKT69_25465 [Micromonospora sp. 4G51]